MLRAGEKSRFSRSLLGMEQVLYRCPNRANPCFSHSLCLEELNELVQLPIASHKTEQPVVAEKSPSTMVG